jgi:hypothetical protein
MSLKLNNQTVMTISPKKRTIRQFKKDYNTIAVTYGHPEIQIKLSLAERL